MTASSSAIWPVLRHRAFRAIWLSGMFSMLGFWMQGLSAAWLMQSLNRSPFMVGLIVAAPIAPAVILAPFAGALSDMFDRRGFLIAIMAWQTCITLLLAILTFTGLITPFLLLLCIFLIGVGSACQQAAMGSLLQDIVPRDEVVNAITVLSVATNLTRAIGPALAGYLVGATSEASAFLATSVCCATFLVTIVMVVKPGTLHEGAGDNLKGAMMGGLRYMLYAKRYQGILIRGFFFFLTGCIIPALLPVLARQELKVGPDGFGEFLALIGFGATITAFFISPYLNARFNRDQIFMGSAVVLALCFVGVGWVRNSIIFDVILFIYGGAWVVPNVLIQVAAQMILPAWVRGRGLALATMALSAGMSIGCVAWGMVAEHISLAETYTASGIALVLVSILTYRYEIGSNETEDV